ncbi:hypothetical protein FH608_005470 [Nonomuraea phyllanthi]|uniref:Helix-turn-helix domain-containing protein n=1 Tax=Nonomuraea phyllanthi TaxID=2219224 RepID=A0A5C4WRJ5_9ACTN|nr:hypothetical protein [Nonomuraea phyllanthi]KAB8196226.1 hypothetical protein FH608_005470 [Nonomuraea phyllanthi]
MDTTDAPVVPGKRLLDWKFIAEDAGIGKTQVFALLKSGELRSVKIGPKTRRVPREWYEEWLESLKATAINDC